MSGPRILAAADLAFVRHVKGISAELGFLVEVKLRDGMSLPDMIDYLKACSTVARYSGGAA